MEEPQMEVDGPIDEGIDADGIDSSSNSVQFEPVLPRLSQPKSPQPSTSKGHVAPANGLNNLSKVAGTSKVEVAGILTHQPAGAASISVALHPLVIMNVAEHWTRLRAQENTQLAVIGALIGRQQGRNYEIVNSYELIFDNIEGDLILDTSFSEQKESQFKQVFPDLDFLGWYSIGESPTEADHKIHKQMCAIKELPIFLKLNPSSRHSRLPIAIYESVFDLVKGETTILFNQINYTIVTEEAERIGLDHMARQSSTENSGESGNSVVAEHLRCQESAVKMLRDRVRLIRDYVSDTKDGKIPWNHEILREAYNLSNRLPLVSSHLFQSEYFNQCNDVALMTYLGVLTKGTNTTNGFVSKFNTLYDRQGMGRRMRTLFY